MKPNTTEIIFNERFHNNLEDLLRVLAFAEEKANQHPGMINVQYDRYAEREGFCRLEAECLTDGSIVYDVWLS